VNGKASKASLRSLGGAQTEGEFGSLMEQLFHPHSASFRFERFESREVIPWLFTGSRSPGKILFSFGARYEAKPERTLSAYYGSFLSTVKVMSAPYRADRRSASWFPHVDAKYC